ncbi:hypothetical protein CVT26_007251 [Gymnopilus dilepis]|uniref:NAD(P)-binding protein n=1 Tax=Gymnopilus dilepis TaxID=231916 RepID=A0A409VM45_9AGAR|nr:hypothetical protein CVT26_007251 [Gymnopilus dilepis]
MFSKKFDPTRDLNDLTGKVAIVTGANVGIGYSTVKHLARKGAKVYLGSRSEEKGKAAVEKLQAEGVGPGEVLLLLCDLGTPSSAKQAGERFLEIETRLDILGARSVALAVTYDRTGHPAEDGITEMMMVNHVGTFQFTKTLLPLLIKTSEEPNSDARIVTVSSNAHTSPKSVNFRDLSEFKNEYAKNLLPSLSRYSVSKLANVLFSNALQRKLASTSIICISLHPGVVNTSTASRLPYPRIAGFLMWALFKSPDEGAFNSCFAAASPAVRESADKFKGVYLVPVGKIVDAAPIARKEDVQDDLWQTTEEYLSSLLL